MSRGSEGRGTPGAFVPDRTDRPAAGLVPARLRELSAEYEITRELGRGGAAVVYHARERDLGREVAIKVVHQTHVNDAEAVARLAREARLVAQLRHPNIVTLFGTRQLSDGGLALVMQYVPGRTLKAAIREDGPLPISVVETVLREMALALHHAHQRAGLVHRDVKPENIYLDTEGGRTLLSDFGIARTDDVESSLTLVGTALGTPAYMSPEQIDGHALDGRSDLYSLGLVAYEMLTGRQPWAGHNLYTIIYKQKHEDLPPLREFRTDVPPHMQRAIDGLLRKDRTQRWRDAARFVSELNPGAGIIAPPALTRRPAPGDAQAAQDAKSAAPVFDDSPTIVYRPSDHERGLADTAAASPLDAPARASADAAAEAADVPMDATADPAAAPIPGPEPAAASADAPVDSAAGADASVDSAAGADAPVEIPLDAEGTPVVRFFFHADDPVDDGAPPTAVAPLPRKRRLPLLVAMVLVFTLIGTITPFIRAASDPESGVSATQPAADGAADGAGDAAGPTGGVPSNGAQARLTALTEGLSGYAGEVLPVPVGLTVEDGDGRPIAGAVVEFEVVSGEGLLDPAVAVSDSGGLAMARWTLGAAPGVNELRARVRGVDESTITVRATAVPRAAARLDVVSGGEQTAPRGGVLPEPVVVRLEDDEGNPVSGARVQFSVTSGGGAVQPASGVSDEAGLVRTSWTLGSDQERHTLRAALAGSDLYVEFTARALYRLSPQVRLVAGGTHSCVLTATGAINCWGANDNGQLGSDAVGASGAVVLAASPGFARLGAGVSHSCALDRDGRSWCWGANDEGQLGSGDQTSRSEPAAVRTTEPFVALAAGLKHTCALTQEGRAFCWGDGSSGQTGDGSGTDRSSPVRVAGGQTFRMLSAGWRHTCGLTSQRSVYCWGSNSDGQLGVAGMTNAASPTRLARDLRFIDISTGAAHTCGVTDSGEAYCWGQNSSGQLGNGTRTGGARAVRVESAESFVSTTAGAVHSCALTRAGAAWCWGRNNSGQLGNDDTTDSPVPVAVAGGLSFTSLTASGSHTCGRTGSGENYCWGYNVDGQLGDGSRTNRLRPVRVRVARR